ncbi:MAG: SPOR domain-containing protein [Bacillota bacterium]
MKIKKQYIILLILPILSMLIGYFGVKWFLLPDNQADEENIEVIENFQENTNKDETKNEKDTGQSENNESFKENNDKNDSEMKTKSIKFESLSFYSIQLASFSKKENALRYIDELEDKSIRASYIYDENFRVYSLASKDKSKIEKNLEKYKKEIKDAFIKKIYIDEFEIEINENDYSVLKEFRDLILIHFENIIENENLENDFENLNNLKIELKNDKIDKNITDFVKKLNSNKSLILSKVSDKRGKYVLILLNLYNNLK